LNIDVDLNLPVGILDTPSGRKPVAADGLLLPDVPVNGSLPLLATKSAIPSERVTEGRPFELVRVVGLAPDTLRSRIKWVGIKPETGLVATLADGPELRFGDAGRLAAKWVAATRVLAATAAKGATYIDLRLPERPAAGGLPTTTVIPLAPAGETAAAATQTTPTTTQTTTQTTTTPAVQNPQPQVQTSPQVSTTP
jgi:cell division protein FtsQ